MSKEVLQQKPQKQKKNGHPFVYTDALIQAMCYLRFKYHLSLRETEEYFCFLIDLSQKLKRVPYYTQICRRMKTLKLPQELVSRKGVTDVVLDTTR